MCSNDCICDTNAATNYANVDWSFWPSVASRGPIVTAPANTVATYADCIKNAPAPTSSAEEFRTFAKSFRDQTDSSGLMDWLKWFEDEYDCAGIC